MTNIKTLLVTLLSLTMTLGLSNRTPVEAEPIYTIPTIKHMSNETAGNLKDFMNAIAKFESGNNYEITNDIGMMGKYQFSSLTLQKIGITTTKENFLKDEGLQDTAMVRNLMVNYQKLRPLINRFSGHWYKGIKITKSGILAGAHLVGVGGVQTFFYPQWYRFRTVDGNGIDVTYYISHFSNYQLNFAPYRRLNLP